MKKRIMLDYLVMTIGAVIQGIAVGIFLEPFGIAPGGVLGIAVMLSKIIRIKTGTLILLINIPLLISAFFFLGKKFFVRTMYATVLSSVFIDYFSTFKIVFDDILLCAVTGGGLVAISLGLIFKSGGTTGGVDIIVRFLRLAFSHLKSGLIFFLVDGAVCVIMGLVNQNFNTAFYSFVALGVSSKLLDLVLYGSDEAKLVFIFSEKHDEIMKKLLISLDLGASYISGEGGFSQKEQKIIMCAIKKSRYPKLEKTIKSIDEKSFMVVSSASEVYGKGFKNYSDLLL